MGAPIDWTEAIVERLCSEIASGRSLQSVSLEDWCPSEASIYRRMAADTEFGGLIARARECQQDHEIEACVRMADEATSENWQVVKMRIWARQWRASKLAAKRYGDRLALAGDASSPITVEIVNLP